MVSSKPELMDAVLSHTENKALACALVHAVSQWLPASINHSPSQVLYNFGLSAEELNGQETTYGLFQFTGMQAREAGFRGRFTDLIDPEVNIPMGIKILENALAQAAGREDVGLMIFLGRSRALLIPGIMELVPAYEKLIHDRALVTT